MSIFIVGLRWLTANQPLYFDGSALLLRGTDFWKLFMYTSYTKEGVNELRRHPLRFEPRHSMLFKINTNSHGNGTSSTENNLIKWKKMHSIWGSMHLARTRITVLIGDSNFLRLLLDTGPPFYVVIRATQRSSRLQGKSSTFISQLF